MVLGKYDSTGHIVNRAFSLALEGIRPTPTVENHHPGWMEQVGSGLLYLQEKTPRCIIDLSQNPQAITLATFTVSQIAQSYLFYPDETVKVLSSIVDYLPEISMETIRFGTWLGTTISITGWCCRAAGRLQPEYIQKLEKQLNNKENLQVVEEED